MLTRQELTLIVAALQFWAEEMDPKETSMLAAYAGVPLVDREWEQADIQRLRSQLLSAQLRYVVCNPEGTSLLNQRLFKTPDAANQAMAAVSGQIGSTLIVDPAI